MATNDTTTVLNPGLGGDKMDESLVTQDDGITQAKRPRVVIGGDDGSLLDFKQDGYAGIALPVYMQSLSESFAKIHLELRRQTALLKQILSENTATPHLSDDELDATIGDPGHE